MKLTFVIDIYEMDNDLKHSIHHLIQSFLLVGSGCDIDLKYSINYLIESFLLVDPGFKIFHTLFDREFSSCGFWM